MGLINDGTKWVGGAAGTELPPGGDTGDVLTKTSPADGDATWSEPPTPPPGSMEGMWWWEATPLSGIPATGMVGINTDNPRDATMLYINWYDMDGVERASMLAGGDVGDEITFTVVGDPESWHRYELLEPVTTNPPGYQVAVKTVLGSAAGTEPASGTEVVVVLDHGGGGTSAASSYRHVQSNASTVWTINHNLGFNPNVTVVDSAGAEIWPGNVTYTSGTQVVLTFSAAVGGEAYLS